MIHSPRAFLTLTTMFVLAVLSAGALGAQRDGADRKPSLSLRATPPVGFSPLRVRVVVDVRGGADDYSDFYCPTIEWDWGDGTISENAEDCDPYEAGKSAIRRRFSAEHVYRQSGTFQAFFRLKQKDKTIGVSSANIQVRAGIRDEFDR